MNNESSLAVETSSTTNSVHTNGKIDTDLESNSRTLTEYEKIWANHCTCQLCSGLEKSPFGAKSDFEIWAFKRFLYLDKKISPKKGFEVSTPKNLKWKKYTRQSENANGRPLEPLWGSK